MKTPTTLLLSACIATATLTNAQEMRTVAPSPRMTNVPITNTSTPDGFNFTMPTNGSSTVLESGVGDILKIFGFGFPVSAILDALSTSECSVCLTTDRSVSRSVDMNFKTKDGESNHNNEIFDSGRSRDCTSERVDGDDFAKLEIKAVDGEDAGFCLCNVYVTCHPAKAGFENAWASYSGDLLEKIYLKQWPKGSPHKDGCPSDCIKFDYRGIGAVRMNIYADALACKEGDDECKIEHTDISDDVEDR